MAVINITLGHMAYVHRDQLSQNFKIVLYCNV